MHQQALSHLVTQLDYSTDNDMLLSALVYYVSAAFKKTTGVDHQNFIQGFLTKDYIICLFPIPASRLYSLWYLLFAIEREDILLFQKVERTMGSIMLKIEYFEGN